MLELMFIFLQNMCASLSVFINRNKNLALTYWCSPLQYLRTRLDSSFLMSKGAMTTQNSSYSSQLTYHGVGTVATTSCIDLLNNSMDRTYHASRARNFPKY
jgi:hypothetical protein